MRIPAALLALGFSSVATAILLGALFPGLSPAVAMVSLAMGLACGVAAFGTTRAIAPKPPGFWDWTLLTVFALASLRCFLWLLFYRDDELCVLSPNNLGDLSLHLNFIRYFADGARFWPEHSILTGVPLTYPPGADLFNSLLLLSGIDIVHGLIWVGLLGALLTGWMVWRWGGAFALAALLFNGGLAGFGFLKSFQVPDLQNELIWKNIFLTMLVTQRGLLFALPAGFLLLTEWRDVYLRGAKPSLPWWLQGLLYATMPLFNIHAFLFLSVILLAIFITKKEARKALAVFVASAFLPATLFMMLVTGTFAAGSGLHLAPGWITGKLGAMAWVWNFGIGLPLTLGLIGIVCWKGDAEERCLVLTAGAIFGLCLFVAFAPWPWDNMKLMAWSWLVIAPYLWKRILAPLPLPANACICVLLFFSGAVSLADGLDRRHGYSITTRSQLDAWQTALADIPTQDRFACVPDYNLPILLLGRKVACGYEGHLWSHGLPYRDKWNILQDALTGRTDWGTAAKALNVQWLALRSKDDKAVPPPIAPVKSGNWGAIYDLRSLPRSTPSSQ